MISFSCIGQDTVDYQAIINPCVTTWQNECISQLSVQEINIITDMLLLSYQVVQASVAMSQARLIIQTELLNIVTLSINDTFDARMQAQNNDLTNIKNAIIAIEQSQEKIKFACNALKSFGPLVININPITIQLFISNLKNVILQWVKSQHKTVTDFEEIQREFIMTTYLFSNISHIFDAITSSDPVAHSQLLQGANSLTDMYKKIETLLADLTIIRQESVTNFNTLLTLYFKYHYQVLYDYLINIEDNNLNLISTKDNILPDPKEIFTLA